MARPTHRMRRGVLVEIPVKWRGQIPSNQTLLQRKAAVIEVRAKRKKRLREEASFDWSQQLGE